MPGFQEGLWKALEAAWRRREVSVRSASLEAFRLVHGRADALPGLKIDGYAGHWLITLESENWLARFGELETALQSLQNQIFPASPAIYHFVANLPGRREPVETTPPETFEISEDGIHFEIHLGSGPHSGLFLDQRENRREARRLSQGRRCLNLFSYTGSFSLAAMAGGADEVVSVDLSKKTLAWLERNRERNGFPLKQSRVIAADAWDYLSRAAKRRERFDLILLDPPSFGRATKRRFSLSRDFEALVGKASALLEAQGSLFVSVNLEALSEAEFRQRLKDALKPFGLSIDRKGKVPFDFPREPGKEPHLKSAWCQ